MNSRLQVLDHFYDVVVRIFALMRFIYNNSILFECCFWLIISIIFYQYFISVFVKKKFCCNCYHVCDIWLKYKRVFWFYCLNFKQRKVWFFQKLSHIIQFFRRIDLFNALRFYCRIVLYIFLDFLHSIDYDCCRYKNQIPIFNHSQSSK